MNAPRLFLFSAAQFLVQMGEKTILLTNKEELATLKKTQLTKVREARELT